MISETNRQLIVDIIKTNKSDYPYYLCFTETNFDDAFYYYDDYIYLYLSKTPITADSDYQYQVPAESIRYKVNTNTATNKDKLERIKIDNYVGSVNVPSYEFIYSNCEYKTASVVPDVIIDHNYVTQQHFDAFGLIMLIIILGCIFSDIITRGGIEWPREKN